jgi:hypothetical protein
MHPDTRKILLTAFLTLATGVVAVALMFWAFGGVSHQGPHTNGGWLALIVAIGCLPTGVLTLALGVAKYMGDRRG